MQKSARRRVYSIGVVVTSAAALAVGLWRGGVSPADSRSTAVGAAPQAPVVPAAALAPVAAADAARAPVASGEPRPTYLALGDSIAFGYSPLIDPSDDSNFVGYPSAVGAATSRKVVNAACPGETSSGFVSLTGVDNGCRTFRAQHSLHADYDGTQLEFAIEFLRSHPDTNLVTLGIGANDLLHCQRSTADQCNSELTETLRTYRANLIEILGRLREVYDGKLVLVNYYSVDYRSLKYTGAFDKLNAVMAQVAADRRASVADTFTAFANHDPESGNSCAAGLLITMPHRCDIHPTAAGRHLLATTVTRTVRATAVSRA
jgi:lysophospholipase L1-like esterase